MGLSPLSYYDFIDDIFAAFHNSPSLQQTRLGAPYVLGSVPETRDTKINRVLKQLTHHLPGVSECRTPSGLPCLLLQSQLVTRGPRTEGPDHAKEGTPLAPLHLGTDADSLHSALSAH